MTIRFTQEELADLARGTLIARGFSPAEAARFEARLTANHKKNTLSLLLECGSPLPLFSEQQSGSPQPLFSEQQSGRGLPHST
jgi:hypothetical protein